MRGSGVYLQKAQGIHDDPPGIDVAQVDESLPDTDLRMMLWDAFGLTASVKHKPYLGPELAANDGPFSIHIEDSDSCSSCVRYRKPKMTKSLHKNASHAAD